MGQEGIASVMKNPRGPPRSLYSVVFQDDDNLYESQTEGDDNTKIENLTKLPRVGGALYVLGSNEQIQVGTITSIAEPYSTGEPIVVGLALIRRADSILKQMKSMDLQIPRTIATAISNPNSNADTTAATSGIIAPPPMDSLDGLEVIVGGTFTIGMLRGVAGRRYPNGQNMFLDREQIFLSQEEVLEHGYVDIEFSNKSPADFLDEKKAELDQEEVQPSENSAVKHPDEEKTKVQEEAAAEAEALRKEEKMLMLKQRAEEAMARRSKKQQGTSETEEAEAQMGSGSADQEEDAKTAEAKRKAEKMEMLRQRAEEAKARRKKNKESED
jgi:hypothetical protein